jgi:hypothetical protein
MHIIAAKKVYFWEQPETILPIRYNYKKNFRQWPEAFVKRGYKLFWRNDNHGTCLETKNISGKEAENG